MTLPEELHTDRLLLQCRSESDAEEIFARYAQDPEVTRFLLWKPHQTIDDTLEFLRGRAQKVKSGEIVAWSIRDRKTEVLLGSIGLGIEGHKAIFGYCLARDAWGRGLATEAVRGVVEACQQHPSLWRLEATCHVDNVASARVLKKCGFVLEGTLRRYTVFPNLGDEPHDSRCFAIVRGADGNWP